MRKTIGVAAVLAGGFALAAPAQAGTPYVEEMTCAVGGETFSHTSTGSYSTFGSRPDGKPYGSWVFPMPIPECPTNRLVMYRNFEDAEIETLTTLIYSDEYKALHHQTTYYRAQWLEDRLNEGQSGPWLLMRAVWQTDEKPELRRAYLGEFAKRVEAMPLDTTDLDSVYLRFLVANAYREMGLFEDASTTLATIPADTLPTDSNDWQWFTKRVGKLKTVIEARDAGMEPLRLIPEDMAMWRCEEWIEEGKADIDPYCHSAELREKIAKDDNADYAADEEYAEATSEVVEAVAADIEANMEAAADAIEDAGVDPETPERP